MEFIATTMANDLLNTSRYKFRLREKRNRIQREKKERAEGKRNKFNRTHVQCHSCFSMIKLSEVLSYYKSFKSGVMKRRICKPCNERLRKV